MKPFEYYSKTKTLYPTKLDYVRYFVYDKGKVLWSSFACEKTKSDLKKEYPNAVIQEVLDEVAYNALRDVYNNEKNKLEAEFVNDLFEMYGVSDNPKRGAAYAIAYEYGHAYGFSEVDSYFSNIITLIK